MIHALAVTPELEWNGYPSARLWWIEGDGELHTAVVVGPWGITHTRLPTTCVPGRPRSWDIAVRTGDDGVASHLFWSNGWEVWSIGLDWRAGGVPLADQPRARAFGVAAWQGSAVTTRGAPSVVVSHSGSPHPAAVAVDANTLYWVDHEDGMVRSLQLASDGQPALGAMILDLHSAPGVGRGLSVDPSSGRIYFAARHERQVEAAIFDTPGLCVWLEDRSPQRPFNQQVAALADVYVAGAKWDAPSPALPVRGQQVLALGASHYVDLGLMRVDASAGLTRAARPGSPRAPA